MEGKKNIVNIVMMCRMPSHHDTYRLDAVLTTDDTHTHTNTRRMIKVGMNSLTLTAVNYMRQKKGTAVPLQAWSGPEGSRKLRFPDFMTTAQDGGKVVSPTHRLPLPPRNTPGIHFC
jgi:hypothetical protein